MLALEAQLSLEQSRLDKELLVAYFEDEKSVSTDFSSYMQNVLQDRHEVSVPLAKELKNLERYIALFVLSKRNNIQVLYDFPLEPQPIAIAPFILFPLIQNALHYGYHGERKYPVRVRGRLLGGTLVLEVSNRVNHYLSDQSQTEVVKLFKSRLEHAYMDNYDLILNSNSNIFKSSLRLRLKA